MSDHALIEIDKLVKTYDLLPVLKGITVSIGRGEFVALLGPNGGGKSTLLRLLCGLTRPSSGSIRVGGWEIPRESAAVRAQIGLVSHRAMVYETLTARENLRFFARLYNLPASQLDDHITALLAQVGLSKRGDVPVRTFSRGMLQRLSIARALVHNPDILLFDEPYTGLDQAAAAVLDELLQHAHSGGRTIIMTTHDLLRAAALPSRVLILSRGALAVDTPAGMDAAALAQTYSDVTQMASTR